MELGFPGGSDGMNLPAMQETWVLIPGLGRSPGGRHSNLLQYSCLENPHGQRSLVNYISFMGLQRVGHGWVTNHTPARNIRCPCPPGRDKEGFFLRAFRRSLALFILWSQTSRLQNCERIYFWCFKSPNLLYFVRKHIPGIKF